MGKQLYLDSNIKYYDLKDFLKAQFVIFRCQNMWKYVKKKGTWKGGNNFTLSLEKGRSILQYLQACMTVEKHAPSDMFF